MPDQSKFVEILIRWWQQPEYCRVVGLGFVSCESSSTVCNNSVEVT